MKGNGKKDADFKLFFSYLKESVNKGKDMSDVWWKLFVATTK